MKTFKVEFQFKTPSKLLHAVEEILISGGFITSESLIGGKSIFVISCNSDTEFAELMIEVGKHIQKHS